jgi:general secretion pathway protein H
MTRTARPKSSGSQLGFSLLELLLVLGILAVALAVVAPSFNRARSTLTIRTAALELASHLRAARAAASAQSVQKVLVFDPVTRKYWTEGAVHPRTLSQSVQMSLIVPDSERIDRTVRIRFLPDGSASGGSIILQDGKAYWNVVVDWLSGDVRVLSGS